MIDVAPLEAARIALGLSVDELWLGYFALGGHHTAGQLGDYLVGEGETSSADHDAIVHVLNEEFSARSETHRLPYSDTVTPPSSPTAL